MTSIYTAWRYIRNGKVHIGSPWLPSGVWGKFRQTLPYTLSNRKHIHQHGTDLWRAISDAIMVGTDKCKKSDVGSQVNLLVQQIINENSNSLIPTSRHP